MAMNFKTCFVWFAAAAALCCACLASLTMGAEGPSTRVPEELLPPGPFEFSHEAYQRSIAKYQDAAGRCKAVLYRQSGDASTHDDGPQDVEGSQEDEAPKKDKSRKKSAASKKDSAKKDSAKKDSAKKNGNQLLEIGQAHTSLVQAQRETVVLGIFAEPAAVDLQFRLKQWQARLEELKKILLNDAETAAKVESSIPKWLADAEKLRQKRIPKAQQLAEQRRWREATEELYELGDELRPRLFWYDGRPFQAGFKPIVDTLLPIEQEHMKVLRKQSEEAIKTQLDDAVSVLQRGVAEIEATLHSCQEGGRGAIDGQELAGPELLTALAPRCRRLSVAACRARSLCWRWNAGHEKPSPQQALIEEACGKLAGAFVDGSRRLIEADASRIQPAEVSALYQRYLQALAPLAAGDAAGALASGMRQPLEKLAAAAPEFAADVAAYARVTGEVLRWRERFASARAERLENEYAGLETTLKKFHDHPPNARKKDEPSIEAWRLGMAAPDFVQHASQNLVSQKVSVSDTGAPLGQARPSIGGYRNRTYERIAPAADLRNLAAELRSDLWASAATPPLTLDACIAIHSAEAGECELAGGTVESLEIESLVTRLATFDDDGGGLVGLAPLSVESSRRVYLDDYLFSLDVKPAWFMHRYGLVIVEK
ncbi:MAG TPA: hypothetical protein VGX76_21210 [Pirellulales bacterium]|nr:hypothetical protein [Pirellulales bacterium]